MSTNVNFVRKHPRSLLSLFGENFAITTADVHELVECIAVCGDVDEGVTEFVDDAFRSGMLACHTYGTGVTFDKYVNELTFPYAEEAFREHLRKIWDECIDE